MTQAALEGSASDFRFLFEASENGVLLATEDGAILEANPGACRILRRRREDAKAVGLDGVFDPSDPRLGPALEEWRRTGRFGGELRMLSQDAVPFPAKVSMAGYQDEVGQGKIAIFFRDITERKQLEKELREKKWLDTLVQNVPDIVVVVEPDGSIQYVSPATEWVLGYRSEEFVNAVPQIVHPEDHKAATDTLEESVSKPGISGVSFLTRFQHKNGSWRYMEGVVNNLLDDPNVKGLVVTGRDVTERAKAEEEIRQLNEELENRVEEHAARLEAAAAELENKEKILDEVEERYRLLLEGSDGVWDWDVSTGHLYWNDRMFEILGFSRSEFTPTFDKYIELLHPEDRQQKLYSIWRYMRRDAPEHGATSTTEQRLLHSTGEYRRCITRAKVLRDENGALLRIVSVVADVTEHKRLEEELREGEKRFQVTFDLAPVGMAHVGTDGRFTRVNRRLCQIMGHSCEDLLEKTVQEVFCPDDVETDREQLRQLLAGDTESYSVERLYVRKDNSRIWVNVSASLIREPSGEPEYCIFIVEDITECKQAQLIYESLAPREIEVLRLLAQGKTNKEIAESMRFSVGTVKVNVQRIIRKLGVSSRTQAALRAVEFGLAPPGGSSPQPPPNNSPGTNHR